MFISPAFAQAASTTASGGLADQLQSFAPLIAIVAVMYFLLFRPQQRKAKQLKEMTTNLRRGDRVVTTGGLIGQISKVVNENEVQLELAEGVRVRVLRSAVTDVLAKTEPVSGSGGGKAKDGDAPASEAPANDGAAAPSAGGTLLGRLLGRK